MRIHILVALAVLSLSNIGHAQGRSGAAKGDGPWFGLPLPPRMSADAAVRVGTRAARPVILPAGEAASPELLGATLKADVDTIVNFAKQSRATKEMGSDQMWGRVSGFPSRSRPWIWAVREFRKAGIADVKVQSITQERAVDFWMPLSWEVRAARSIRRSAPAAPTSC